MDGLLLDTEDIYTQCADNILLRHHREPLPWSVKAKLMGVPGSNYGETFHDWAKLPISREQYREEHKEEQRRLFPLCQPLPGARQLLETLTGRTAGEEVGRGATEEGNGGDDGRESSKSLKSPLVKVALASSSELYNYRLKTEREETRQLLDLIRPELRILADRPRGMADVSGDGGGSGAEGLQQRDSSGRGKPAPDIFLAALDAINATMMGDEGGGATKIRPEECLVFEDSVTGVEAARRAGMRVVWVPHEGLAEVLRGSEGAVLAGRTGMVPIGEEHQLGQEDDGWAEQITSLEEFDYEKYGIVVPKGV